MRVVFAVLLFLLLLSNCSKPVSNSENVLPIYSTFKNSAIYSATGDFDGDGKTERMFITKPDENYYIAILYKDNILYKRLTHQADNLKLTIQDINSDHKEDIILNIVENNCENCYVYMVDTDIITTLSPNLIKANINLQRIKDYITYECGNFNLSVMGNIQPNIRLYYTEMDYMGDELVFVSEGAVFNKNTNILNIQTTVSVDQKGTIVLKKIDMLPVNN